MDALYLRDVGIVPTKGSLQSLGHQAGTNNMKMKAAHSNPVAAGLALICVITGTPLVTQTAIAQPVDASRLSFDIHAKQMEEALTEFAQATQLQVLFQSEIVRGIHAPSVTGSLTPESALKQMLANSGLRFEFVNDKTVAIRAPGAQMVAYRGVDSDLLDESTMSATAEDAGGGGIDDTEMQNTSSSKLPEMLIKGNRSLNAEIKRDENDVQPYIILGSKQIERSGATTLESFLRESLTPATKANSASQTLSSATGNATSIDLRGLGDDETLILVNGRRIASINVGGLTRQPDLNGIPLAAIERIEILPSTASGVFGGGATGGAINVVLKQNYNGIDTSATYEAPFDVNSPSRRINLSGGFSPDGGTTNILVMGSYSDVRSLYTEDRNFVQDARSRTIANNPAAIYGASNPPLGATSNIRSTTGVLTLKPKYGGAALPANFTYVPDGYLGVDSDNGRALVANAGQYNLDLADTAQASGNRRALLNGPLFKSLATTIRRHFGERFEAFAEFSYSENNGSFRASAAGTTYSLAANAASNPFVQAIRVTTPGYGLDSELTSKISSRRAVVGASYRLSDNWNLETEYAWSRSRVFIESPATLNAPGTASVTTGSLNVFQDAVPLDFSPFTITDVYFRTAPTDVHNPAVRVAGSLPFSLPGGAPSLTVAAEYRKEELGDAYRVSPTSAFFYPEREQSVRSVYAETRIPLVSEKNARAGVRLLELQLAARNERYKTLGANTISLTSASQTIATEDATLTSTNPTIGLRYAPVTGLMFRSSYATGFLPPNVSQLVPSPTQSFNFTPQAGVRDRRRGNEFVVGSVEVEQGGNPELLPEKARTWGVGVVWTPTFVSDLRISVDGTKIEKRNNIGQMSTTQMAIDNEQYVAGLVTRAAATPQNDPKGYGSGPIIGINQALVNFARIDLKAVDLAIDYRRKTLSLGTFGFTARGTRLIDFDSQFTPVSLTEDLSGTLGLLDWAANTSITWDIANWSVGWQTQYYDKYWLDPTHVVVANQGSATVPSQIYHDVFAIYRFDSDRGVFSGTTLQVGVKNVFDREPPIVATDPSGYSGLADPRKARYYLTVGKTF